jgi:hypothetical protein
MRTDKQTDLLLGVWSKRPSRLDAISALDYIGFQRDWPGAAMKLHKEATCVTED